MKNKFRYNRKQYMAHKCTHQEYYAQFVNDDIKRHVISVIGEKAILESQDPYFNDISIKLWDSIMPYTQGWLRDAGDYPTLSSAVCIAKEAARQIRESGQ